MSNELVRLTIDGIPVEVPAGTLLVDAAKQVGVDIPVFCYHPKMEPVGMCRMCLVEIGRPVRDRATGEYQRDDQGELLIRFGPKLETACTTPVGADWQVKVNSPAAVDGRAKIVEFLLTSHPLDCPTCDKGGECSLQNLTMEHGLAESRFQFEDKIILQKQVRLGELIYLDQQRCIQCGRCIRFQEEIAADPVLAFFHRGRATEIITHSSPGFDSIFSGNTTDLCPVGALTTSDFHFGARTWELDSTPSLCNHCPVGCNLMFDTRREAKSGGKTVVKRVMPRQHEAVNEIWLCDKGRFVHHYTESDLRLTQPLLRRNGELVESSWEAALQVAADGLKKHSGQVTGITGGRASNEGMFQLQKLMAGLNGKTVLHDYMGGGDVVRSHGMAPGSNLAELKAGDAIVVIASDLHQEAPLWWLRVRQAAQRGVSLIVLNGRRTRLDKWATFSLPYSYPQALQTVMSLVHACGEGALNSYADDTAQPAAAALKAAENVVVFFGSEGLSFEQSTLMATACAKLVELNGVRGEKNNGVIPVWSLGNTQGAWELGIKPDPNGLADMLGGMKALVVMAADPLADDLRYRNAFTADTFLIVQELFLTETASKADVVFPALSYIESEGTFTSADRRVQRFFEAVSADEIGKADWEILALLGEKLGIGMERFGAAGIMRQIAEQVPAFAGINYQSLRNTEAQWPDVGGKDLYFAGNAARNEYGLGMQLPLHDAVLEMDFNVLPALSGSGELLIPVTRLYDQGTLMKPTELLVGRIARQDLYIHPDKAGKLQLEDGAEVIVAWNGVEQIVSIFINSAAPQDALLLPRSVGAMINVPVLIELRLNE